MPENIPAAGAEAPAATPTSAVSTPVVPAPAASEPRVGEPDWLPGRIAQAKKNAETEFLKQLGVDSLDAAKAKVAEAKKLEDEKKSELQKRDERIAALELENAQVKPLREAITTRAAAELAALNDAQRDMVTAIAGDDVTRQLATIETLRKGGAFTAPVATQAGRAPVPAAASTTAAGGAPAPADPTKPNLKASLESLEKTNPMAAASFALRNQKSIYGGGTDDT